MIRAALLAAALGLAAAAAQAQGTDSPGAEAAAQDELAIPFEPPLGEALRYRYTRSDTRDGETRSRSVEMRIRFARDGDDYAMTVDYVVPAGAAATDPGALLMRRALSLAISADGVVLGLADEEAYWAAMQAAIRATVRESTDTPEVRTRMEAFLGRLRALPAEERLALVTENFLPIVTAAGALLPLGEDIEQSDRRETAMGTMTQNSRMRIERVAADRARLTTVMTIPAEDLEGGMAGLLRELVPEQAADRPFRFTGFEDRTVQLVSLATGLTEHWEMRRAIGLEAGEERIRVEQVRTVERLP